MADIISSNILNEVNTLDPNLQSKVLEILKLQDGISKGYNEVSSLPEGLTKDSSISDITAYYRKPNVVTAQKEREVKDARRAEWEEQWRQITAPATNDGIEIVHQSNEIRTFPIIYGRNKIGGIETDISVQSDYTEQSVAAANSTGELSYVTNATYFEKGYDTDRVIPGFMKVVSSGRVLFDIGVPEIQSSSDILETAYESNYLFLGPDNFYYTRQQDVPRASTTISQRWGLVRDVTTPASIRFTSDFPTANDTGKQNEYLTIQMALGYGEFEAVRGVEVDRLPYDDEKFSHSITYQLAGGVAEPIATSNGMNANNTFYGLAYLTAIFKLNLGKQNYSGVPKINSYVLGRKVHSIVENSGVYSLSTTRTYSTNPARCLLDYLMNPNFGPSTPLNAIDLESFYSAQQICDQIVQPFAAVSGEIWGSTTSRNIPRFECNLSLSTNNKVKDNIEKILNTMHGGELIWSEGKYKLTLPYPTSQAQQNALVAAEFTNDDVIRNNIEFSTTNTQDRYTQVSVKFRNELNDFEEDEVFWPETYGDLYNEYLLQDRTPSTGRFNHEGITDPYHAVSRAEQIVRSSRSNRPLELTVSRKFLHLELNDLVRVNISNSIINVNDIYRIEEINTDPSTLNSDLKLVNFSYLNLAWNVSDNFSGITKQPVDFNLATPADIELVEAPRDLSGVVRRIYTLSDSDFTASATRKRWFNNSGLTSNVNYPSYWDRNGGTDSHITDLRIHSNGQIRLNNNAATDRDFSDELESEIRMVIESDGHSLEVYGITDTTDPYAWTPSNSADVIAFFNAIGDDSLSGTLTFSHSLNSSTGAGRLSWVSTEPVSFSDYVIEAANVNSPNRRMRLGTSINKFFDLPDMVDGTYDFYITARTQFGRLSEAGVARITIDRIASLNGSGYEFVYRTTTTDSAPPDITTTTDQDQTDNYVPPGWTATPSGISSTNTHEWISTRAGTRKDWDKFSDPTLFSRYAADGAGGDPGSDGSGAQFVYIRTATDTAPTAITTNAAQKANDSYVPTGWTNNPTGVDSTNKFEWVSSRLGSTGAWGEFSAPARWARYSEDGDKGDTGDTGQAGQSGSSVQFIFINTEDTTQPATPSGDNPTNWSFSSQGVTSTNKFEWVSSRTRAAGSSTWSDWSTPGIFSRFSEDGEAGEDGDPGEDGSGIEFVFQLTNSSSAPTAIGTSDEDTTTDDNVPSGWTDTPTGVSSSMQYEWASTRTGTTGNWGSFSAPFLWAKFGADGQAGTAGNDGSGIEFIFQRNNTGTTPGTIAAGDQDQTTDNDVPTGWTANPAGVDASNKYEYAASRTGSTGSWSVFSTPYLFAKFGEDGATGSPGEDGTDGESGEGVEFIFRRTAVNTAPATPSGDNPASWTDNPTGVDSTNKFEWVSSRTRPAGSSTWGDWSSPGVFARFSEDGVAGSPGTDGAGVEFVFQLTNSSTAPTAITTSDEDTTADNNVPSGWTANPTGVSSSMQYEWASTRTGSTGSWNSFSGPFLWAKFGADGAVGSAGQDGSGVQFIFRTTTNDSNPGAPTSDADQMASDTYVPTSWNADAQGVTSTNKFEWVSSRTGTTGSWGNFSTPGIWARFSEDGSKGDTGDTGAPGQDGSGIQFIFINTTDSTQPDTPASDSDQMASDTYVPTDWNDDAQGVDSTNKFEWVSSRVGSTGSWGNFSTPALWSRYSEDGATGEKGDKGDKGDTGDTGGAGVDGTGVEFVFIRTADSTTPSQIVTPDNQRLLNDYVPTGWTADPVGVDSTNKYEWVSSRQGSNNNWSEFSAPGIWAKFSEDGTPGISGSGAQFIYTRTSTSTPPTTITTDAGQRANNNYVPTGWVTSARGVDSTNTYEWVSSRTGSSGAWGEFSTPAIWALFSESGVGRETIYYPHTSETFPSSQLPDNTWGYLDYGLQLVQPSTIEKFSRGSAGQGSTLAELEAQCVAANRDATYSVQPSSDFTAPTDNNYIIRLRFLMKSSDRITNTVMRLPNGVDHASLLFLVKTDSTGSSFNTGSNDILAEMRQEAITTSATEITDTITDAQWGAAEADGDYYFWWSYYFIERTGGQHSELEFGYTPQGDTAITAATIDNDHDLIATNDTIWTGSQPSLTETNPYIFSSSRAIVGQPSTGDAITDMWSTPVLGATRIKGDTGDAGQAGQSGSSVQFVFRNTTDDTAPDTPTGDSPASWNTSSQGVTSTNKFEWVSSRTRAVGSSVWSSWSTPGIFSRYAEDGEDGADGEKGDTGDTGQAGQSGASVQFVFINTANDTAPDTPTGDSPASWSFSSLGVTSTNKFEWVSSRTRAVGSSSWSDWSTPGVFARFSEDGATGGKGDTGDAGTPGVAGTDGSGIEFIFQRNNTGTAPTAISAGDQDQTSDNNVPTGWTANPTGVASNNRYEYAASRTGSTGSWSVFSTPYLFAKFGEKGDKGDTGSAGQDGTDGSTGESVEFIFRRTANSTTPTTPSGDDPASWTANPTGVDSTNKFEWVSNRTRPAGGSWSNWSTPGIFARYSEDGAAGEDGEAGADGAAGDPGTDGSGIEFIFQRNNTGTAPSRIPNNMQDRTADNNVPDGWTASPSGVASNNRYEYACSRIGSTGSWARFSVPYLFAKFGEKGDTGDTGQAGQSGASVQFVFRNTETNTQPATPSGDSPASWNTSAQGVTSTNKFEWVSSRTRAVGGAWGSWSTPGIFSRYSEDGAAGADGDDGDPGADGSGIEFVFRRVPHTNQPGGVDTSMTPARVISTVHKDDDISPNGIMAFFIMSTNYRISNRDGSTIKAEVLMNEIIAEHAHADVNMWIDSNGYLRLEKTESGTSSTFSIQDPQTAQAVNVLNFLGIANGTYTGTNTPDDRAVDGFVPRRFTADPQGVSEDFPYEWAMSRTGTTGAWNEFSDTYLFAKFGADGQTGTAGNDGTGIEFIFQRNNTGTTPAAIATGDQDRTSDNDVPTGWTANPTGVNATNQYEYAASRTGSTGSWSVFSAPYLFAKFGADGATGAPGEDGTDGSSGEGVEFIFRRTTNNTTPDTPSGDNPASWTDNPTGVDSTNKFEWVSSRTRAAGSSTWSDWSSPGVFARFSEDGATGAKGDKGDTGDTGNTGAPGQDGSGVEFVFQLTSTSTAPAAIGSSDEDTTADNNVPSGWTDNPTGVSSSMPYEWASTRTGTTGSWGSFSGPFLWAKFGADGAPGTAGSNGAGIQFVFQRNNTGTPPTAITTNATQKANDSYTPTGWTASATGVDSSNQYEYASSRTGSTGAWGEFSSPYLFSKFGANGQTGSAGEDGSDGTDGSGVQFVYRLSQTETTPTTPTSNATQMANDSYVPTGWTANASGVSTTNKYEYVTSRVGTSGNWGDFSAPGLFSRYAEDGSKGDRGDTGQAGQDGSGIQFIFRLTNTNIIPALAQTNNDRTSDTFIPEDWTDNPSSVSNSMRYEWAANRTGSTGNWSDFGTPYLFAVFSSGGGGSGVELIYQRNNTGTSPTTPVTTTTEDQTDEFVPGAWRNVGTAREATLDGLKPSTEYIFGVRGVNDNGEGNTKSATVTTKDPSPPGPVRNLTYVSRTVNSLTFSWVAPNTGGSVDNYRFRHVQGRRVPTTGEWTATNNLSATITGLNANTIYTIEVQAVNEDGESTSQTEDGTTDRDEAPGTVRNLAEGTRTQNSIAWSWDAPNSGGDVHRYEYRFIAGSNPTGNWTDNGTNTSVTIGSLNVNTLYTIEVRGWNSQQGGGTGTTDSATTRNVGPGPVRNIRQTAREINSLSLAWDAPNTGSAATGYEYRLTTGSSAPTAGAWTSVNTTSAVIGSLAANTQYTIAIRSTNTDGESDEETITLRTDLNQAPGSVGSLAESTVTHNSIRWNWTAPTTGGDLDRYEYRIGVGTPTGAWISVGLNRTVTVPNLAGETTYTIQVRAWNSQQGGGTSSRDTATTHPTAPGPVRNLSLKSRNISAFTVEWDAPNSGGTPSAFEYRFTTGSSSPSAGAWTEFGDGTQTELTVSTGVAANTQYTIAIRTKNITDESVERTVTFRTEPQAVPGPVRSLRSTSRGSAVITWQWDPPNTGGDPDRYEYRYGTSTPTGAWTGVGTDTSVRITGLEDNTSYTIEVRGWNSHSGGGTGSTDTVTTLLQLPDASAPTVTINALPATINEGDKITLGYTLGSDGTYDTVGTVTWTTSEGSLSSASANAPEFDVGYFDSNTNFNVNLSIVFEGDGTTAETGTSATGTAAQVSGTVIDVDNEQEIGLLRSWYGSGGSHKSWTPGAASRPSINRALRSSNVGTFLSRIRLRLDANQGEFHLENDQQGGVSQSRTDLSDKFESGGSVSIGQGRNTYTFLMSETSDTSEPYTLTVPTAKQARYQAVRAAISNNTARLIIRDYVPAAVGPVRNLAENARESANITWVWDAPNTGTASEGYEYRYSTGTPSGAWTDNGTATSVQIMSLTPNTQYTIEVRAYNIHSESSGVTDNATTLRTAPGPVRNISRTAREIDDLSISWDAPNTGGTTEKYQYAINTGSSLTSTTWVDVNATNVTIGSLAANTEYTIGVRAVNNGGNSTVETITDSTDKDEKPGPVRNLGETATTDTSVTWEWDAPTTGGDPDRYEYRWYIGTTIRGTWRTGIGLNTSVTITSLTPNRPHGIQVRAWNSQQGYAATADYRTDSAVTLEVRPNPPSNLRQTSRNRTDLSIAWDAPTSGTTPTHYEYRYTSGSSAATAGNWTTENGTSITISSLTANTQYTISVRAVNNTGESNPVNITLVTEAAAAPGAPTNLRSTSKSDTSIAWAWGAPTTGGDPDRYEYRRYTGNTPSGNWLNIALATTVAATGLTSSTAYGFQVRGWNSHSGAGTPAAISVTTNPALPAPITGLSLKDRDPDEFTVEWANPAGSTATSFEYRFHAGSNPPTGGAWTEFGNGSETELNVASGVNPNTQYTIAIRTKNVTGTSAQTAVTLTSERMGAPGAPTSLTTPVQTGNAITFSWSAPTSGGDVDRYEYRYYESPIGSPVIPPAWTQGNTDTSVSITGLDRGTRYILAVRGWNAHSGGGDSASITRTTLSTLAAPVAPTITITGLPGSGQAPERSQIRLGYTLTGGIYDTVGTLAWSTSISGGGITLPVVALNNQAAERPLLSNPEVSSNRTLNVTLTIPFEGDGNLVNAGTTTNGTQTTSITVTNLGEAQQIALESAWFTENDALERKLWRPADNERPTVIQDLRSDRNSDAFVSLVMSDLGRDIGILNIEDDQTGAPSQSVLDLSSTFESTGTMTIAQGRNNFTYFMSETTDTSDPYFISVPAARQTAHNAFHALVDNSSDARLIIRDYEPSDENPITNLRTEQITDTSIEWAWDHALISTATGYEYRFIQGTTPTGNWTDNGTARTVTISSLTVGAEYTIEVRGYNDHSESTGVTHSATTVVPLPGTPQNLVRTARSTTSLSISWDAPASGGTPSKYQYAINAGSSLTSTTWVDATGTSTTISGLAQSTEYTVGIRAVNDTGEGTAETITTSTEIDAAPGPVRNLRETNRTGESITWSWDPPDTGGDADSYWYRYRLADGSFSAAPAILGNVTTVTVTGLTNNTAYVIEVSAFNAAHSTGPGVEDQASTLEMSVPPNSVKDLSITTTATTSLTFAWTPDDEGTTPTSYEYRYGTSSSLSGAYTSTTELVAQITGLTAATEYHIEVRGAIGSSKGPSVVIQAYTYATSGAPDTPSNLKLTSGVFRSSASASSDISMIWDAPVPAGGAAPTGYQYKMLDTQTDDDILVEYVFAHTDTASVPDNDWGYNTPGIDHDDDGSGTSSDEWFDAAPLLNFVSTWLRSQRVIGLDTTVGDQVTANWSAPETVERQGIIFPAGAEGQDGFGLTDWIDVTAGETSFDETNTYSAGADMRVLVVAITGSGSSIQRSSAAIFDYTSSDTNDHFIGYVESLEESATTSSSITWTWTLPGNSGGFQTFPSYRVSDSLAGLESEDYTMLAQGATTVTISSLDADTEYYIELQRQFSDGTGGGTSIDLAKTAPEGQSDQFYSSPAIAPTVRIIDPGTLREGQQVNLSVRFEGESNYQDIESYSWNIDGGSLDNAASHAPLFTAPYRDDAGDLTVVATCDVRFRGYGSSISVTAYSDPINISILDTDHEQSILLPSSAYRVASNVKQWHFTNTGTTLPGIDRLLCTDGTSKYVAVVTLGRLSDVVTLHFEDETDSGLPDGDDLSDKFEQQGQIEIIYGDNSLVLELDGVDTSDFYRIPILEDKMEDFLALRDALPTRNGSAEALIIIRDFVAPTFYQGQQQNAAPGDIATLSGTSTARSIVWTWSQSANASSYEYLFNEGDTLSTAAWTADPQGVSESLQYEYVSLRKGSSGDWGKFSIPALWAKFGAQGADGRQGVDGQPGQDGDDGPGIQFVFRRNNSSTAPGLTQTNSDRTNDSFIPTSWSDDPSGVSNSMQYEWASVRTGTTGNWNDFGSPFVWAKWGPQGVRGADGSDGAAGTDGFGFEYIFATNNSSTAPTLGNAANNWGFDTPGIHHDGTGTASTVWFDGANDAAALSATNRFLWRAERQVPGSISSGDEVSNNWSTPVVVGRWGNTGNTGAAGTDGSGIEFIFQRNNSGTTPGTIAAGDQNQSVDNNVPTGWTDDPSGVTSAMRFEYASTRTGTTGNWGRFSTPYLWAKFGEKGDKGDKGDQGDQGIQGPPGDASSIVRSSALVSVDINSTQQITLENLNVEDTAASVTGTNRGPFNISNSNRAIRIAGMTVNLPTGAEVTVDALVTAINNGFSDVIATNRNNQVRISSVDFGSSASFTIENVSSSVYGTIGITTGTYRGADVSTLPNAFVTLANAAVPNEIPIDEDKVVFIRNYRDAVNTPLTFAQTWRYSESSSGWERAFPYLGADIIGDNVITARHANFDSLSALSLQVFDSDIVDLNVFNVAVQNEIKSDNYVEDEAGFLIAKDGRAQFPSANIIGRLTADQVDANNIRSWTLLYLSEFGRIITSETALPLTVKGLKLNIFDEFSSLLVIGSVPFGSSTNRFYAPQVPIFSIEEAIAIDNAEGAQFIIGNRFLYIYEVNDDGFSIASTVNTAPIAKIFQIWGLKQTIPQNLTTITPGTRYLASDNSGIYEWNPDAASQTLVSPVREYRTSSGVTNLLSFAGNMGSFDTTGLASHNNYLYMGQSDMALNSHVIRGRTCFIRVDPNADSGELLRVDFPHLWPNETDYSGTSFRADTNSIPERGVRIISTGTRLLLVAFQRQASNQNEIDQSAIRIYELDPDNLRAPLEGNNNPKLLRVLNVGTLESPNFNSTENTLLQTLLTSTGFSYATWYNNSLYILYTSRNRGSFSAVIFSLNIDGSNSQYTMHRSHIHTSGDMFTNSDFSLYRNSANNYDIGGNNPRQTSYDLYSDSNRFCLTMRGTTDKSTEVYELDLTSTNQDEKSFLTTITHIGTNSSKPTINGLVEHIQTAVTD